MTDQLSMVLKEIKTRIIQALSEMSPEVRSLIAEVSYAQRRTNKIELKSSLKMTCKLSEILLQ